MQDKATCRPGRTCDERCPFSDLIVKQCAHCTGDVLPPEYEEVAL